MITIMITGSNIFFKIDMSENHRLINYGENTCIFNSQLSIIVVIIVNFLLSR